MRHEDYKELLALEAAGALADGEGRALGAHLSRCEECRAELDALRDAAAALVYSVAPVAPPAHLRQRVIESVRALGVESSRAEASQASAGGDGARGPSVVNDEGARRLLDRLGFWRLLAARPSFAFGAAAAVCAVVALAALSFALWTRTGELRSEVARLSANANVALEEVERARADANVSREELARASEFNQVLTSSSARVARLAGKGPAPAANALVAYDMNSRSAVLLADGLPPAPAGKAYQLWFMEDGKPVPGSVFETDARGRARMRDRIPSGMKAPSAFAVTLERKEGELTPKGAMYLLSAES